jgi:fermentation-respiration switch protein FrsA (DUF1100 family)
VLSLGGAYLLVLLSLLTVDRKIFLPPPVNAEDLEGALEMECSDGVSVLGRYLPGEEGMPTLLWSFGNGENIVAVEQKVARFHRRGFGVLTYNYRGYGLEDEKPSEVGCYHAIEGAYRYLTEELKVGAEKIILVGQSVGSGPTCWLAVHKAHAGVVLISPFISTYRTVTGIPLFPGDRFVNIDRIEKMKEPLLVVHGTADGMIPYSHGERMFALSPSEEKEFLPIKSGRHNDLFTVASDEIFAAFDRLAERVK